MTAVFALDTHAFVWFLEGNPKLSKRAINCIVQADAQLLISVIAIAEILFMIDKNRTTITSAELQNAIDLESRLTVQHLDKNIVFAAQKYARLEIHDRLIIASAESVGAQLITADRAIRESASLATIW